MSSTLRPSKNTGSVTTRFYGERLQGSTERFNLDTGPQVEWLRERLESLMRLAPTTGDPAFFDRDLEVALKKFQRSQQLRPDGIAGPNSLIRLHSSADIPVAKLHQAG